jgi:hypothetical protein
MKDVMCLSLDMDQESERTGAVAIAGECMPGFITQFEALMQARGPMRPKSTVQVLVDITT